MAKVFFLDEIIGNTGNIYLGNLRHYFKAMFQGRNVRNPYHNIRHVLHVLWLCFDACIYYKDTLTPREKRNLLIAAMFHDFDHSGRSGHDDLEIERALRGLEKHISEEDLQSLEDIKDLIRKTQFPHTGSSLEVSLSARILRDADISQVLNNAWIQQIAFGLADEMNISQVSILAMQESFLTDHFKPTTEWAQKLFPSELIKRKIIEAKQLVEFLK